MPPAVDVVIVAYNRYDLTESCLRHLAAQTREHRTILIDNGSTDETSARVAAEWPAVSLHRLPDNRGFAEACNTGVAVGSGEYVVLLNNDVDVRPDFIERVVSPLQQDVGIGSVAALMLQPGEELIDSAGLAADAVLGGFPRLQGLPVGDASRGHPLLAGPAGTAAAYRRAAWEQVGGLDESIFAYMEDFDLTLRLRAAGWRSALAADAIGVHLGSATHGHRSARQRRNGGFGRGYMLRRYGLLRGREAPRALATEAVVVLADLAISRDVEALRGRLSGWRAARGMPRRTMPPEEAIDASIGFRDSLALRRGVYARRSA
ncbi:MAG TPA: glycosyltransferase family 2 protein [Solirubrobacteraceae bacterium]|nr:glycosyltransferase family 2 protein [Solirubrobacteraceae bacterium]